MHGVARTDYGGGLVSLSSSSRNSCSRFSTTANQYGTLFLKPCPPGWLETFSIDPACLVARHAETIQFSGGDTLVKEGARGHEVFILVDGQADADKLGRGLHQRYPCPNCCLSN